MLNGGEKDQGKLHPDDKRAGYKWRKVHGIAKKPENLTVTVSKLDGTELSAALVYSSKIVSSEQLEVMVCDSCSVKLPAGLPVVAVTMYRESEVPRWETEYLKRVSREQWLETVAHFEKIHTRLKINDKKP